MDFGLQGKLALVTGCRTGIGQAVALALAASGADVAGVGHGPMPETAAGVTALGRQFLYLEAELSQVHAPHCAAVVAAAADHFGRVDILVNNAGTIQRQEAMDHSEEQWDQVLATNLKSVFLLSQAAARRMRDQGEGGKIVNIASMLSYQGGIRVPSYTASKSGVLGLTRALANEWAQYKINVNGVAPGYIRTNNTAALQSDPGRCSEILSRIPAGRWGDPEDIGGAVAFLCSSAADYIHGFTLAVDGGWLAR